MVSNVVPLRRPVAATPDPAPLTAAEFESRVHELAKDSAKIALGHPHFQQRLAERGITMRQVLQTLREGSVIDGPKKDEWGDWRVKLQRRVAGRRVQVVVAVKDDRLDVVTAI